MFNKLFGKNTNFEEGSHTNIIEDSISIRNSIDYVILRAGWDEYVTIKSQDPEYQYAESTNTPAWKALEKVLDYGGDLSQFGEDEQHLLRALRKGFFIYADVLHVMIDHHDDVDAANDMFKKHPDLHAALPSEYDNPEHAIEVIIEVIRDYQWQLEHFSIKHEEVLLDNITRKDDASLLF
jgi:hypothetical protein